MAAVENPEGRVLERALPEREIWLRKPMRGPVLVAIRTLVGAYALLALIVYVRWLPGWLVNQAGVAAHAAGSGVAYPYVELADIGASVTILAALAWFALAAVVFVRRSRDLFGLLLVTGFLSFGFVVGTFNDAGGLFAAGQADWWSPPWPAIVFVTANVMSLPWAFCFPDGRFVPRWTIVLGLLWALVWIVPVAVGSVGHGVIGSRLLAVLIPTLVAAPLGSMAYRYWHGSNAVERQQLKWIALGALVFVVVYLLVVPTGALALQQNASSAEFLFQTLHSALFALAVIAIPIVIGISIFRQGLLDIDLIINRTLAYGAVTAILAIGFIAISGVSNLVLEGATGQRSEFVLVASIVPVALAFMPVRARALKIADRFVADHKVMTLLFLDMVGSTDRAYSLGDRSWRELLERFRTTVRRCLRRYGGKEIETAGDGFFITFGGPQQALRCAHKLITSVRPLGVEIRIGVHIGEVEVDGTHVEGANVHLAARVMSEAGPGEVLVSQALREVIAGSDIELQDRGRHALKGVPGEVQLYAAFA